MENNTGIESINVLHHQQNEMINLNLQDKHYDVENIGKNIKNMKNKDGHCVDVSNLYYSVVVNNKHKTLLNNINFHLDAVSL